MAAERGRQPAQQRRFSGAAEFQSGFVFGALIGLGGLAVLGLGFAFGRRRRF
jgi:hypothetical protein